ncbi:hypothetical protein ACJX0J_025609, partial [Zea mays]
MHKKVIEHIFSRMFLKNITRMFLFLFFFFFSYLIDHDHINKHNNPMCLKLYICPRDKYIQSDLWLQLKDNASVALHYQQQQTGRTLITLIKYLTLSIYIFNMFKLIKIFFIQHFHLISHWFYKYRNTRDLNILNNLITSVFLTIALLTSVALASHINISTHFL